VRPVSLEDRSGELIRQRQKILGVCMVLADSVKRRFIIDLVIAGQRSDQCLEAAFFY
jgi:hypothetical protein